MRPRALAVTIAAGAASAVAVALLRLKRPRAGGADPTARPVETYRCACGEEFRVSGTGRHRVFWRAGAADDDPLLTARCPSCERALV
jgi:hypothetical protein